MHKNTYNFQLAVLFNLLGSGIPHSFKFAVEMEQLDGIGLALGRNEGCGSMDKINLLHLFRCESLIICSMTQAWDQTVADC